MKLPHGVSWSLVCLAALPCRADEEKPRVPTYTDEDLERVAPLRDQTGVLSQPAYERSAEPEPARKDRGPRSEEARWRREAERHRNRLRGPRAQAEELRVAIDRREREPGVRPVTDPKLLALRRRLELVERRIREADERFEERARREGALPGWLR